MTAIQSALSGMQSAESQLDTSASQIANLPFPAMPGNSSAPPPQDNVSLSTAAVNLLQARDDFAANAKVAKVADEVQQSTMSILA
ncbi:MAG: flagellar basal body rod C-terminal domain-containing protein [Bryobacteraceae bacterium]|jgi:flagellar hook protein FlgE